MPICNLRGSACSALLCNYHEASLAPTAFVCLMLLFTSMQLKFFNIASVNTQAHLHPHPLRLLLRTRRRLPPHKSLFTEHYSQLQRHQEDFRISCQMGKVLYGSHDFMLSMCTHNDTLYPWKFIENTILDGKWIDTL